MLGHFSQLQRDGLRIKWIGFSCAYDGCSVAGFVAHMAIDASLSGARQKLRETEHAPNVVIEEDITTLALDAIVNKGATAIGRRRC